MSMEQNKAVLRDDDRSLYDTAVHLEKKITKVARDRDGYIQRSAGMF